MNCDYACNSPEHTLARRTFLGGLLAGAGGASLLNVPAFAQPEIAKQMAAQQKNMLLIWLAGGVSQFETWDPKPGTRTGGPFRAIPSSVPGTHVSELIPHTAKQMHRLSLIRSIDTGTTDHGLGAYEMRKGHRKQPGREYPELGAVCAKGLDDGQRTLPGFIRVTGGGGGTGRDSAYLGPRYASLSVGAGKPPIYSEPPKGIEAAAYRRRQQLRAQLGQQFTQKRRTASTDAFTHSFDQAAALMERRDIFDSSREPEKLKERYGHHQFGRHCLMARRLLEHGASFVEVTHSNYDTHNENFIFHLEQMGEFDRTFATLIDDMAQRGMLENTFVLVMSEFGRTPKINRKYGRDHWGKSWSVAMAGSGVHPGAVVGTTNETGEEVTDRPVDHADLFHTFLRAVGIDSKSDFIIAGKPVPVADPAADAIEEILI